MAFGVSIGFVNERSGAVLGLLRGESLQGVDLLPVVLARLAGWCEVVQGFADWVAVVDLGACRGGVLRRSLAVLPLFL